MHIAKVASGASGAVPSKAERLQEIVEHYREHRDFSGTVYARWGSDETFSASGGLADESDSSNLVPNHAATRYLIASITKTYVATAILKLEEAGGLSVNDPLSRHVPEYPRANLVGVDGSEVTIHHLLSHTAGLPSHFDAEGGLTDRFFREPISFQAVLDSVKGRPLRFAPGSSFEYSNTGYVLLGEVIRRVSGSSTFGAHLHSEILMPIGLAETVVNWSAGEFARPYVLGGRGRRDLLISDDIIDTMTDDTFCDGNIFSTAADVGTFFAALASGRILAPTTFARMTTPVLNDYGYGIVSCRDSIDRLVVTHNGSWIGFKSYAASYPELGATIVYLMNQLLPDEVENDFRQEILDAILGP